MGCCFSRSEGPNSPYPGGGPSGSARAIIIPAPITSPTLGPVTVASPGNDANSSTPTSSQRMHSASFPYPHQNRPENAQARPRSTLAQHINKPLRRRRWTSRNRVWSRHSIDHERVDFFDTRVTGRPEIWQTLRAALEVLWEADSAAVTPRQRAGLRETADGGGAQRARQDAGHNATIAATSGTATKSTETAETAEALATAQSMLDAAGITLPTSDLAQGAYDALGNFYAMPPWVVSDPTNIESDSTHELEVAKGRMGEGGFEDEEDEDENYFSSSNAEEDDGGDTDASNAKRKQQQHARQPSLRRRRVEKGKAVAVPTDQIAVRARLSATSRDVVIYLGREETVRSLVHRISEEGKLPHKTRIRIAYLGKILKDGSPLVAQGWKEGHVVNALVFDL